MFAGRLRTGGVVSAGGGLVEAWTWSATALIGELLKRPPVDQEAGSAERVLEALVWVLPPLPTSRNWTKPVEPAGARTAIQYRCPAVTAAPETATSVKLPAT